MTPEVENAVQAIKADFPDSKIEIEAETQGGAYVVVHDLSIGEVHIPSRSWVGFLIDFQCPRSDVYPHYIDAGIKRADAQSHKDGFSGPVIWQNRQALQVSRRSNRWNPAVDTPLTKLHKVLEWLRTR